MYNKEKIKLTSYTKGGGWASKIDPGDLFDVLSQVNQPTSDNSILGYSGADDAAAYRISKDKTIIQTVDFFTPIVDDPYTFGQIAASNALSDIYAMGGKPLFALNIVGFPMESLSKLILKDILQGGADKANEAGIPILGGHSVKDSEPKYGLVVTGEVNEKNIWKNSSAQIGDVIILTKPIGTGIIANASKKNAASKKIVDISINQMKTLNKYAADRLLDLQVNAVTDITGFGLLGHLNEVCEASDVTAEINFNKVPLIEGSKDLAINGFIPGGTRKNLDYYSRNIKFNNSLTNIQKLQLADAQTSGGLLVTLKENEANKFIKNYNSSSSVIGKVIKKEQHNILVNI